MICVLRVGVARDGSRTAINRPAAEAEERHNSHFQLSSVFYRPDLLICFLTIKTSNALELSPQG